ncbi:MAG: hypothetical protein FWB76_03900 [Oscillospiraceae bacterium]|nr:hypothetical protein [Oscillospiraceae bacterium]
MKKCLSIVLVFALLFGVGGVSASAASGAAIGRSFGLGGWHQLEIEEDGWHQFEWIYGSMGRVRIVSLAHEQTVHEFNLGRFQRTAVVFLSAGSYSVFVSGSGYYELRISRTEGPSPTFWQRWGRTVSNVIAGVVVVAVIAVAAYITFSAMD